MNLDDVQVERKGEGRRAGKGRAGQSQTKGTWPFPPPPQNPSLLLLVPIVGDGKHMNTWLPTLQVRLLSH